VLVVWGREGRKRVGGVGKNEEGSRGEVKRGE